MSGNYPDDVRGDEIGSNSPFVTPKKMKCQYCGAVNDEDDINDAVCPGCGKFNYLWEK